MFRCARSTCSAAVMLFTFGAVPYLTAQTALIPAAMVAATCETVKPGMGVAHDQHEERWARAIEAVKGYPASLAIQSATGPAATCWLTPATSYEQIGKLGEMLLANPGYSKALASLVGPEAQYISDSRNYIAVLRPDLTAGELPNILTRRVTNWQEWRVRFGQEASFAAAVKAYRAAATRAGVKPEFRVYQVLHGLPQAAYWIFASQTGYDGFDVNMANNPKIVAAYTPDDIKVFDEFSAKGLVSYNANIWTYVPGQSVLTAEQRATDKFWKLKAAPAKMP